MHNAILCFVVGECTGILTMPAHSPSKAQIVDPRTVQLLTNHLKATYAKQRTLPGK